jgi:quinolinate synthase
VSEPSLFDRWYQRFSRWGADLYPGRYNREYVKTLAEVGGEVLARAREKRSTIVAHNYQYPELHEVADMVGDSLGLSQYVASHPSPRVDFCGVLFMGETAKTILGDRARVFMPDRPGCSLVASIDQHWIDRWRERHPEGLIVSYINTDAETKAKSDYICTSRNAALILAHAARERPNERVLFLPDKYLGALSVGQAGVDPARVDLYDGACHVHAMIGERALDDAIDRHPDAELLIHPECGCSSSCMARAASGQLANVKAYYCSTEQMLWHARHSPSREFIVATETGMVYRLRRDVPEKTFHPVSPRAVCEYMKMNTLEKLLDSLQHDRVEVRVDEPIRLRAQRAVERMLTIH